MAAYEVALIFHPSLTEEQGDTLIDGLGVNVTNRQKWGKRLFTYPIKKHKEGTYVLCDISADTQKMQQLTQKLNLEEQILRYLIVEQEAIQ